MKKFIPLNAFLAGTGYQMYPRTTKVRVQSEEGDFLFYSKNITSALKRIIPNGCGGLTLKTILKRYGSLDEMWRKP